MAFLQNTYSAELSLPEGQGTMAPGEILEVSEKMLEVPGVATWVDQGKVDVFEKQEDIPKPESESKKKSGKAKSG